MINKFFFRSFFNDLPLDGTKGELLLIKAPNLKLDVIINSGVFIIPIGNDLYKVGATYDVKDLSLDTTPKAFEYLTKNVDDLLKFINEGFKGYEEKENTNFIFKDSNVLEAIMVF